MIASNPRSLSPGHTVIVLPKFGAPFLFEARTQSSVGFLGQAKHSRRFLPFVFFGEPVRILRSVPSYNGTFTSSEYRQVGRSERSRMTCAAQGPRCILQGDTGPCIVVATQIILAHEGWDGCPRSDTS